MLLSTEKKLTVLVMLAIAFAVLEMLQRGDDHLLHDPNDEGITDFLSIR